MQLVDQALNLPVGGVDQAFQAFLLGGFLGLGPVLMQLEHLLSERNRSVVLVLVGAAAGKASDTGVR